MSEKKQNKQRQIKKGSAWNRSLKSRRKRRGIFFRFISIQTCFGETGVAGRALSASLTSHTAAPSSATLQTRHFKTNKQTNKQTNGQTNKQINKRAKRDEQDIALLKQDHMK